MDTLLKISPLKCIILMMLNINTQKNYYNSIITYICNIYDFLN